MKDPMIKQLTQQALFLLVALGVFTLMVSCSSNGSGGSAPREPTADQATLLLPLQVGSQSGVAYRLRDAQFAIENETTHEVQVVETDESPRTELRLGLDAGDYAVEISSEYAEFRIDRVFSDGTREAASRVELLSPVVQHVTLTAGSETRVRYRFAVDGVDLGSDLILGIEVNEREAADDPCSRPDPIQTGCPAFIAEVDDEERQCSHAEYAPGCITKSACEDAETRAISPDGRCWGLNNLCAPEGWVLLGYSEGPPFEEWPESWVRCAYGGTGQAIGGSCTSECRPFVGYEFYNWEGYPPGKIHSGSRQRRFGCMNLDEECEPKQTLAQSLTGRCWVFPTTCIPENFVSEHERPMPECETLACKYFRPECIGLLTCPTIY
jgi:hypothetical protein